jgi:sterol 3beta-glucosyltransferase
MRIVLTNFGTVGDLHPLIALAVALRARGHACVIAYSPGYEWLVGQHDLAFAAIGPDPREAQDAVNRTLIERPHVLASREATYALLEPVMRALPELFEDLRRICEPADLLIAGPAQPAARMVHELTGVPFVSLQFSNFGGAGTPAFQDVSRALINPHRARLGLAPLAQPLTADATSSELAIYAVSRHLFALPPGAPTHHRVTGFFFLDRPGWRADGNLAGFCAAGDPPIAITFGSMPETGAHDLRTLARVVAHTTNRRVVLQASGARSGIDRASSRVFRTGYVDHHWLFARAACVVHHGGSGTTAAVLRAGVPSVFVPHVYAFDQPYWARLAAAAGCSAPCVAFPDLTAQRLSHAIHRALHDEQGRRGGAAMAEAIDAEGGVDEACRLIEGMMCRQTPALAAKVVGAAAGAAARASAAASRSDSAARRREHQRETRSRRRAGAQDAPEGSCASS